MRQRNNALVLSALVALMLAGTAPAGAADVVYDAGGRRDPFVPLEGGDEVKGRTNVTMVLEGIVYDPPANSVVLIGGQPCKVGDAVGDGKVLEIRKDHVVVELNLEKTTLWLREDDRPPQGDGSGSAS